MSAPNRVGGAGGGPGRGLAPGLGSADHEASGACEIEKLMQPTVGQRSKGRRPGQGVGCAARLTPPPCPAARSSITSEGNELLVQFVSDLSVTADGFSASYRTQPRGATEEGPGEVGPGPKPGAGPKVKPEVPPEEKPKAAPKAEATPVGPGESGKGEEATQASGSCIRVPSCTQSFIQHPRVLPLCWDPKLDRALNKFKAMRLLWGKCSFLPAG